MEVETQLLIAGRLGYLPREAEEGILGHTSEVGRMLPRASETSPWDVPDTRHLTRDT